MAPAQSQSSKLFTRDLTAYSDAELDLYLEANKGEIDVEDPETLKVDKDLVQRLRARGSATETAQCHPIDLKNLTARLQSISADRQALRPPLSPASSITTPYNEEEYYRHHLEEQTEYYDTLINEGGRPSHPVSLGQDVIENPGEYREILSYWQSGEYDWKVFESQMGNWRRFRRWQHKNRGEGRFPKYVEGVTQGLAEHGFMRSFKLEENPEQQDKLTTWIEYLDFEYWWYDKDMRFVKHHQPRYDEAWKKLVDSQVLRPFETQEVIWDIDSVFQRASEEERAEKAVASATSAVMLTQKPDSDSRRSNLSQREPQRTSSAAQSELDAAIKSFESIRRLNDLVGEFKKKTKNYQLAKRNAERRISLLRWILQQVPLIELELSPAKVAESDSNKQSGEKRRLKRNCANELSEGRLSKRPRHDGEISDHRGRTFTTPGGESQVKCSFPDSTHEGPVSKRPRYKVQNHSRSLRKTSDAADSTSIEEPSSIHLPATRDSGDSASRSPKAGSVRQSAPNRTRPAAKTFDRVVQDGKARVKKKGMQGEKSRKPSTLVSRPLRRSTRTRRQPERFQ